MPLPSRAPIKNNLLDMERLKIEHKLTDEQLQALFQGKKLVLDYYDTPMITLMPPRYGVFMTNEKYVELERKVYARAFEEVMSMLHGIRKEMEEPLLTR